MLHRSSWWLQFRLMIIIIASLIGVHFLGESTHENLAFTRSALADHEYWRLLTSNFVHTNSHHVAMNILGLLLTWGLFRQHFSERSFIVLTAITGVVSVIGVWMLSPQYGHYAGLSASLHGLLAFGAIKHIQAGEKEGWVVVTIVGFKVLYEQLRGASDTITSLIDASVNIDAHLYGLVSGILLTLLPFFGPKKSAP